MDIFPRYGYPYILFLGTLKNKFQICHNIAGTWRKLSYNFLSFNCIADAVINSAWFFFVAGAVMSVALVLCGCGFGARKRKILMFTSGVAFIFAGRSSTCTG